MPKNEIRNKLKLMIKNSKLSSFIILSLSSFLFCYYFSSSFLKKFLLKSIIEKKQLFPQAKSYERACVRVFNRIRNKKRAK